MTEFEEFEGLREFTISLVDDHLAIAMYFLFESQKYCKRASHLWRYYHRYSMSSILHSFMAFESALNLIGYELFVDSSSSIYIPPEKRDIPLNLMIDRWWSSLPWNIKFLYIVSIFD